MEAEAEEVELLREREAPPSELDLLEVGVVSLFRESPPVLEEEVEEVEVGGKAEF